MYGDVSLKLRNRHLLNFIYAMVKANTTHHIPSQKNKTNINHLFYLSFFYSMSNTLSLSFNNTI